MEQIVPLQDEQVRVSLRIGFLSGIPRCVADPTRHVGEPGMGQHLVDEEVDGRAAGDRSEGTG